MWILLRGLKFYEYGRTRKGGEVVTYYTLVRINPNGTTTFFNRGFLKNFPVNLEFERTGQNYWREYVMPTSDSQKDISIGAWSKNPEKEVDLTSYPKTLRSYEFQLGDTVRVGPDGGYHPSKIIGRDVIWGKAIYLIERPLDGGLMTTLIVDKEDILTKVEQ